MLELRWRTALELSVSIRWWKFPLLFPSIVLVLEGLLIYRSVDPKVPLLLADGLLLQVAALAVQSASDLVRGMT